jgi:hypothetical protein
MKGKQMALDITNYQKEYFNLTTDFNVPHYLDFPIRYENTRFRGKKYVINGNTSEVLGIVGDGFPSVPHGDFFRNIVNAIVENFGSEDTSKVVPKFSSAHNGAVALLDITFPNISYTIHTNKHTTEISQRAIAWHGIDGTKSNLGVFGAVDDFCTNGMITGTYEQVRKKNTSGFSLSNFVNEIKQSHNNFIEHAKYLQRMADTNFHTQQMRNLKELLEPMGMSKRMASSMHDLFLDEASVRGANLWSLYSAMTNYSSHTDNGFKLKDMGNDTRVTSMWDREQKVVKWTNSDAFKELLAA